MRSRRPSSRSSPAGRPASPRRTSAGGRRSARTCRACTGSPSPSCPTSERSTSPHRPSWERAPSRSSRRRRSDRSDGVAWQRASAPHAPMTQSLPTLHVLPAAHFGALGSSNAGHATSRAERMGASLERNPGAVRKPAESEPTSVSRRTRSAKARRRSRRAVACAGRTNACARPRSGIPSGGSSSGVSHVAQRAIDAPGA